MILTVLQRKQVMKVRNSKYWEERFLFLKKRLLEKGDDYEKELIRQYKEAEKHMVSQVESYFERFEKSGHFTREEATRILTTEERRKYQMTLMEYIQKGEENAIDGRWMKELENAANVFQIQRFQVLQFAFRQEIELLKISQARGMTDLLIDTYTEGYYRSIFEIQRGTGYITDFVPVNARQVERLLVKPWASDGKNFSDRIWTSKGKLIRTLEEKMAQSVIRGDAPDRLAREISDSMGVSRRDAMRLVQTENAFFSEDANSESYTELEVEMVQFLATLDLLTSVICREHDKTIIKLSDCKIGENIPPLHPCCRSTKIPYFEDMANKGTRAARDPVTGKGMEGVPKNMTYKQWYQKCVVSNPKAQLEEKKLKNYWSDQQQYKKYRKLLGEEELSSFSDFQTMKYSNTERWKEVKKNVRKK